MGPNLLFRWFVLLVAVFLLSAAPFLPASADAQDADDESDDDRGSDDDPDDETSPHDGPRGEADDEGDDDDLGEKGQAGLFEVSGGMVQGRFLSFSPDLARQDLLDVRIGNATVFASIAASAPFASFAPDPEEGSGRLEFRGDAVRVRLHDSPTALLNLEADHTHAPGGEEHPFPDVTFTLAFADGVQAAPIDNRTLFLTWENVTARLRSDHDVVLGDHSVTVTGQTIFLVHGERALLPAAANHNRDAIDDALAHGVVGAQVTIVRAAGDTLVTDTVSTRDLDIDVNHTGGRVRVTVDSADHRGTVLVLIVDRDLVGGALQVRFWDVSNNATELSIVRAGSLADVLDPHDDGLVPEYRLVKDDDGWQLLLSIPGFSAKRVELAPASIGLAPILPIAREHPLLVVGTFGAVVALGMAGVAMFRRPRGET